MMLLFMWWPKELPPLTYTWFKIGDTINPPSIVGGNENTLSISTTEADKDTSYKVIVSGICGAEAPSPVVALRITTKPLAPDVPNITICDAGNTASRVIDPKRNETYRWYSIDNLVSPVYDGRGPYTMTLGKGESRRFKVYTVVNQCESSDFVFTTVNSVNSRTVNLGEDLFLCPDRSAYDLSADIGDDDAKGGTFTWLHNRAVKTGNLFAPTEYKAALGNRDNLSFNVSYTPSATGLSAPNCFQRTDRNVSLVKRGTNSSINGSNSLIKFKAPVDATRNTIMLCVNTGKQDLSTWVEQPKSGVWAYGIGGVRSGLTGGGTQWYYEPNASNYDDTYYNELKYTINVLGCVVEDIVKVFVKGNFSTPSISVNSERVCQDENFTLTASVENRLGFSFVYSKVNDDLTENELSRKNPDIFRVDADTKISVYSIDEVNCSGQKAYITVKTPFGKGKIESDRSSINIGEAVKFSFAGITSASYLWDFGDGGLVGRVQNPVNYYYKAGDYITTLTIIGNNSSFRNCPPKTFTFPPITVTGSSVETSNIITGLENINTNAIFPNPVSSLLICRGMWIKDAASVRIVSMDGKMWVLPLNNGSVDISGLSAGIYAIQCNNTNFRFIKN